MATNTIIVLYIGNLDLDYNIVSRLGLLFLERY